MVQRIAGSAFGAATGRAIAAWGAVWLWCYPEAQGAVREAIKAELRQGANPRRWPALIRFLLTLPYVARTQAAAEREPSTQTAGGDIVLASGGPFARRLREALVLAVALGWLTTFAAVFASFAVTGNFVMDSAPMPGQAEEPSPYFHIAAPAFIVPILLFLAGLLALRLIEARGARRVVARAVVVAAAGRHADAVTDSTLSVLPVALGANWVYALPSSEGLLLVDAGPDYPGAWEELGAQLDVHGYRPEQVRAVVVTHSHIDHSGLAARWQAVGAEVCGSRVEAERFELGFEVGWYDAGLVLRFLDDCGVPGDRMARLRERWPPSREAVAQAIANPPANLPSTRWPGMLRATPFRPERSLEEGDEVRVGERTLRYVPTPGHTPGDSVYYEAASGALFSGDHLLPRITSNPGIHFRNGRYEERMRSLPEMARSLTRVRALRAGRLYPGHGEATVDVEGAAARTTAHHRRRQRKIVRLLRDGPLTPYEVLTRFFPHLPDTRLRQAMAEVTGQIDALVEAGAVEEERVLDGALRIGRVESGGAEGLSV